MLVTLQQDQAGDARLRALMRQFRSDRPASPGDHHRAGAEVFTHQLPVELDGFTAEQVLDRHFAKLEPALLVLELVGQSGDFPERQAGRIAKFHHAAHLRRVGRRHRDYQQAGGGFARDLGQFIQRAEYLHALDLGALQHTRVVEQANRVIAVLRAQFTKQHLPGAARTEDKDPGGVGLAGKRQAIVLPESVDQPGQSQPQDQERRIGHQHAARHLGQHPQHHEDGHDQQQADEGGAGDVDEVGHAGKAPDPAIEADTPEDDALDEHYDGEFLEQEGRGRRPGLAS